MSFTGFRRCGYRDRRTGRAGSGRPADETAVPTVPAAPPWRVRGARSDIARSDGTRYPVRFDSNISSIYFYYYRYVGNRRGREDRPWFGSEIRPTATEGMATDRVPTDDHVIHAGDRRDWPCVAVDPESVTAHRIRSFPHDDADVESVDPGRLTRKPDVGDATTFVDGAHPDPFPISPTRSPDSARRPRKSSRGRTCFRRRKTSN